MFKKLKFECFIEIFESIFKKIDSNYIKKWCKVFKFRRFRALQPYQKLNTSAFLKSSMDEISLEEDKNPRSPVLSNKIKWIIFNTFISVIVIVGIVLAVVFATKKKEEEEPEYIFSHNISYYQEYMRSIGEFLTVIQMDDGAILNHRILTYAQTKMVPYFSCTAAEGFLASGNESLLSKSEKIL